MRNRKTEASPPDPARGARIRAAREAKKLSQAQVAEAMGVSRVAVTQWEGGDMPEAWRWSRLATILDASLDHLILGKRPVDERLGPFFTPRAVIERMVEMVGMSPPGEPIDPFAGTGGTSFARPRIAELLADPMTQAIANLRAQLATLPHAETLRPEFSKNSLVVYDADKRVAARVVPFVGAVAGGDWLSGQPPYPLDLTDPRAVLSTKASEKCFALEVVGDSMSAVYPKGSRIVVDPGKTPKPGEDDAVVRLLDRNDPDFQVTLKRVIKLDRDPKSGESFARVLESRPAEGTPTRMTLGKNRARILGTVVDSIAA